MGGINAVASGANMPVSDCTALYNLRAAERGLRTRPGWREWVTGLTGSADNLVRTIVPFTGSAKNGTNNRMFATTSTGIWDVSSSTDAPTEVFTFASSTGEAGVGVFHAVTTTAGHFLFYADEVNGLHLYSEASDTWSAVAMGVGVGQISGVDPADVVFVTVFKKRVWLVVRDSAIAYYLDAGAIAGAATAFNFGPEFKAGGPLIGLWHWTYDGGSGLDDALVGISGGGDVAIYKGTDPDDANAFGLDGVWQFGAMPAGRRLASEMGGEMLVTTRTGIVPLSKLVVGAQLDTQQYSTFKIGPLFNQLMLTRATQSGWSMRLHPEDGTLVVTVPEGVGQPTSQLVMSLSNRSWSMDRDVPIYSCEAWGGKMYFGTVDGRVCVNDGDVDGVTLDDPDAYTSIQYALLSAFSDLGLPVQKQVQAIRVSILSDGGSPSYDVGARYGLDFSELPTVTQTPGSNPNAWDVALWDSAVWAGEYSPTEEVRGAVGMGTDVAIILRGASTSRTVVVGFKVAYTAGGFL